MSKKLPNYIQADLVPVKITAASIDGKQKLPTFDMVAYNGGMLNLMWWEYPVVIDLQGVAYKTPLEINYQHSSYSGVGHATDITIDGKQITASGVISRENECAKDVAQSGVNGFPWQASIGAIPDEVAFIAENVTASINGQSFTGPFYHVIKSTLKHISFVEAGADSDTSVTIAAMAAQYNSILENKIMADGQKTEPQVKEPEAATPIMASVAIPAVAEPKPEPITAVTNIRAAAIAETERIAAIRKACPDADIQAKAIGEGWTVEAAELAYSKSELAKIRASRPDTGNIKPKQEGANLDAKVFEINAMRAAGIKASTIEKAYTPQLLEAADKTRRHGLTEMIEAAAGVQLGRYPRDAQGQKAWLNAAFSTISLPGILSNVANKVMWEGYNSVDQTWREIAKVSSVSDFKTTTRYRLTEALKFEKVGADGEIKHGTVGEIAYTNKAETYGKMISITRQMLINDDLGAFAEIPAAMGIGAADGLNEIFWALWLANAGDFFGNTNNNIVHGTANVLSFDGLTEGYNKFMAQTKPNGSPLGVEPEILLVPSQLKLTALRLMQSETVNETTTANKPKPVNNIFRGMFRVASTPYLSNTTIHANGSATGYYLLGNPQRVPCIDVAFLNGVDKPTVEQAEADFNTLGIQMRGYYDFGVALQDYRGGVWVTGVVDPKA